MPHVVLLGDSIFDNGAYVHAGEPDVVAQLRARLADDWSATLCAVDGSVTSQIAWQLDDLPADATHLVISSGGNDALGHIEILDTPSRSTAEALARLAAIAEEFTAVYANMLTSVRRHRLPVVLCTIYEGRFDDPLQQRLTGAALATFNDVIVRQAIDAGVPLIDLRRVCCRPEHYANPIEPSAIGGECIAATIAQVLREHDFARPGTRIYG